MKSILLLVFTSFLFGQISQAASEPIIYYGTCYRYDGVYEPSKTPVYTKYLTTQGQVLPSWPFGFQGNPHRFTISYQWGSYLIVNEDLSEVVAEQEIIHGQELDLRYHDLVSGLSVRCVKTGIP